MDEKWYNLVIQEIHTLGQNVAKLDRKVDIKLDKVNERVDDTKTCLNSALNKHNTVHAEQLKFCGDQRTACAAASGEKVGGGLFRWAIGILVVCLLGIGGLTAANKAGITKNNTLIERHIETSGNALQKLDDHINSVIEHNTANENRRLDKLIEDEKENI